MILDTKKISLLACSFLFAIFHLFADTKTWTGIGGDGLYSNPLNWSGNSLPASTDDLLFDNSYSAISYSVTMPDIPVVAKSITITPSSAQTIKLILPSTNLNTPAITTNGGGYALVINSGGIFQNSSGLTSGSSLSISDSIRINNGGRYIHNTRSMHASNIVQILSKAPGTETGIFEFDTPGTQGYTVSISNRTYGTLILSSASSTNGTRTYTGSGSNPLTINGDLQIGVGVTFKSDLASENGNINLKGNLVQSGGMFDLASGPDNTILKIKGNVNQSPGAAMTESSTGQPAIELEGSILQNVSLLGIISNNIIFRMNNPAGALLQAPLSLPYKLELLKGEMITTSANLLTLQAGVTVFTDSTTANTSFINGPLRKEGLSSTDFFLFPVGKTNEFRWVELKNATGNFVIEYIAADARTLSTSYSPGVDHISTHGYWSITTDIDPVASAQVELSFADASGSGVTDMATLKAAQLNSGVWIDRNNISTTGTPGASGSVVSEFINSFPASQGYFVLASSVSDENPLPVILTSFSGEKISHGVKLNWQIASPGEVDYFEIWSAGENSNFEKFDVVDALPGSINYSFNDKISFNNVRYYKLRIVQKNSHSFFSQIVSVKNNAELPKSLLVAPSPVYNYATVFANTAEKTQLQFMITSADGRIVSRSYILAEKGTNSIPFDFSLLASGVYILSCFDGNGNIGSVQFVKL